VEIPPLAPIRQVLKEAAITDLAGETHAAWQRSSVGKRLHVGDRVAVAVGSRGIADVSIIVRATLETLRDWGTHPFVVAAMGSHGGGTPEGQRQLLADYGISEEKLRVPVKTEMTTVEIGTNPGFKHLPQRVNQATPAAVFRIPRGYPDRPEYSPIARALPVRGVAHKR